MRHRRSTDHRHPPTVPKVHRTKDHRFERTYTPMRVVIAGAGSVGRSIARELLHNGHQVLLIDKDIDDVQAGRVPEASWLLCSLTPARPARCTRPVWRTVTWSWPRPGTTRPTWWCPSWPRPSSAFPARWPG